MSNMFYRISDVLHSEQFSQLIIFQVIDQRALWTKFNNEKIMSNVTIVFMILNFTGSRMCAWLCVYVCLYVCVCGQFRKTQFLH